MHIQLHSVKRLSPETAGFVVKSSKLDHTRMIYSLALCGHGISDINKRCFESCMCLDLVLERYQSYLFQIFSLTVCLVLLRKDPSVICDKLEWKRQDST